MGGRILKRIHFIGTDHPHWAKHSGYHQLVRYVSPRRFAAKFQLAPMGVDRFPIKIEKIRSPVRTFVRKHATRVYDLNDLVAEVIALRDWCSGSMDLLHYLDGEHSMHFLPALFGRFRFWKRRPQMVATFHQPPAYLNSLLNIKIVRFLDQVIVLSPEQKRYFAQFLPRNRVSLILHGVDADYYSPGPKESDNGRFKCISVGSWLRDYECVLEVARLLRSNRDIEFHVVTGELAGHDVPDNVYVHQDLEDDELLRMYQTSDVLFVPLRDSTVNNVLLEGIACGLPVVCSDLSGPRAYVAGDGAILVKDNNRQEFASTLLELQQNKSRLAVMAAHARQRALELSWRRIVPQLETIYSALLQSR